MGRPADEVLIWKHKIIATVRPQGRDRFVRMPHVVVVAMEHNMGDSVGSGQMHDLRKHPVDFPA